MLANDSAVINVAMRVCKTICLTKMVEWFVCKFSFLCIRPMVFKLNNIERMHATPVRLCANQSMVFSIIMFAGWQL